MQGFGAGTLEGVGYAYNPFTASDIWGGPTPLAMPAETKKELPVGGDDGALPQMAENYRAAGAPRHQHSTAPLATPPNPKAKDTETSTYALIAFALIVGAAFYFKSQ